MEKWGEWGPCRIFSPFFSYYPPFFTIFLPLVEVFNTISIVIFDSSYCPRISPHFPPIPPIFPIFPRRLWGLGDFGFGCLGALAGLYLVCMRPSDNSVEPVQYVGQECTRIICVSQ